MAMSERLNTPISTAELERRWQAVRAAMAAAKIDVLLMQNNNDYMGGYVKYFTDTPATNGYPNTVVFPREDEMTVVCQGPFGGVETSSGDGKWRGVKQVLTTPSYASAHYTKDYDPELAAKALKPFAAATIGTVGSYQMSVALLDYLRRAFPSANFVDATELVDKIKVIKSAEEMELVKRAAAMQDGAMRCCLRGGQARHARHRGGGSGAALQPLPRQRERDLSVRFHAARQPIEIRQPPCAEPRHPGRRPDRAAGGG